MKTNSKFQTPNSKGPAWLAVGLLALAFWLGAPRAQAQGLYAAGLLSRSVTTTNAFVAASRASTVYTVTAYNASASDLYMLIFDATSLPANNTVPTLPPLKITSGTTAYYDFNVAGAKFANGIVVATSTTPITLTNGSASFLISVTHTPK